MLLRVIGPSESSGRRLTHGVAVWVVLEGVLPDEVGVGHELPDGDVLVLVDVAEQRGEIHGLPDHQQVVRDLEMDGRRRFSTTSPSSEPLNQPARSSITSCVDSKVCDFSQTNEMKYIQQKKLSGPNYTDFCYYSLNLRQTGSFDLIEENRLLKASKLKSNANS